MITILSFECYSGRTEVDSLECSFNDSSRYTMVQTRAYNPFNGSSTHLTLGAQYSIPFQYLGQKQYFDFDLSDRKFIKLNYSGANAKLKIYYYDFYNYNDYLFYSPNIDADDDIIYCDNQHYLLEFESISSGMWIMDINLECLFYNSLSDSNPYILHIMYNSNSTFGYRYDVEYFDVASTSTNTNSYCNYLNVPTSYLNLISSNLNFGISNDARYLVNNTLDPQYSAIAYQESELYVPFSGSTISSGLVSGSATFVDATTIIGCAHMFYLDMWGKTTLPSNVKFYPGANSYQNPINWYSYYGEYTATDTYLPMKFLLVSDLLQMQCDWSITLTECSIQGDYNHSYMALEAPSIGDYSVHSAGYPGLYLNNSGTNYYDYAIWTSYPLSNNVSVTYETVITTDNIVVSNGNSGGPLYRYIEVFYNGVYSGYLGLIGVCSRFYAPNGVFTSSYFCKITPRIINIYREVT